MSAQEEAEEHLHHAETAFDKSVAGTMAIIAALLAIVSVLGQHFNTEELLNQQQASDQWAFSQAKDIRRYSAEIAQDALASIRADPKLLARYSQDSAKYLKQREAIQEQARELEHERDRSGRRANQLHFGEVFLEIAIVLSSLAILSKMRLLFWFGVAAGAAGIVISALAAVV